MHLLVFPGGDLLQEVSNALALGACKPKALKELHDILSGTMVHQVTYVYQHCSITGMIAVLTGQGLMVQANAAVQAFQ